MINDYEAAQPADEPAGRDEPEPAASRAEEPLDWRTDFRSYVDDPE